MFMSASKSLVSVLLLFFIFSCCLSVYISR